MLDFICVLLIFIEIIFTVFCVKKLCALEIKVNEIHVKMLDGARKILEINDEIRNIIQKTNKIIKILANKRLHQIRRIIMYTIDIVQVIILIKSLNLQKGKKALNFKILKNLAYAKIIQQIIKKILDFTQNLCAI